MKHIVKGNEPQSFIDWKKDENKKYKDLKNPIKSELKNALLLEQGFICCYCESKISADNSHIEHLKPKDKDKFPELQLNYDNLLCSCQKKLSKGEPRHCGNSKDNNIISITPLTSNCEDKFTYTLDGQIKHTDLESQKTIEYYLKLDIEKLNILRESAIDSILFLDPSKKDELLSEEDRKIFVEDYLTKENGQYKEFYTTIKCLFSSDITS